MIGEIYTAPMGECNPRGIGEPALFVRFRGCNLRCYRDSLSELCDTPDFLDETGNYLSNKVITESFEKAKVNHINTVCITGGEPLLYQDDVVKLAVDNPEFLFVVETNGTIQPFNYLTDVENIVFVYDYKLKSAGITEPNVILNQLRNKDFLKFVIHNKEDYKEAVRIVKHFVAYNGDVYPNIYFGVYWGGEITTVTLINWLKEEKNSLFGLVKINVQMHKLIRNEITQFNFKNGI